MSKKMTPADRVNRGVLRVLLRNGMPGTYSMAYHSSATARTVTTNARTWDEHAGLVKRQEMQLYKMHLKLAISEEVK